MFLGFMNCFVLLARQSVLCVLQWYLASISFLSQLIAHLFLLGNTGVLFLNFSRFFCTYVFLYLSFCHSVTQPECCRLFAKVTWLSTLVNTVLNIVWYGNSQFLFSIAHLSWKLMQYQLVITTIAWVILVRSKLQ